jgi:hypothetical protein
MVEGRNIKLTIALKTAPTQATTLGLIGNTNITNTDSQVVTIGQL